MHHHVSESLRTSRMRCAHASLAALMLAGSLAGASAQAQQQNFSGDDNALAQATVCRLYGCNHSPQPAPPAGYDPCYLRQNALRPCPPPPPVGVEAKMVGIWTLPLPKGNWVLEVFRDGRYRFHSEAADGVQPHEGTFAAINGRWALNSKTGWADGGTYQLQDDNVWLETGRLGPAAWHRVYALSTAAGSDRH